MDKSVGLVWKKKSPNDLSLNVGGRAIIRLKRVKSKWRSAVSLLKAHSPGEKTWLTHFLAKPVVRILNGELILHGALLKKGKTSVLIVAPSGTGKSTLSLFLISHGWQCFTDDMTAIRVRRGKAMAKGVRNSIALTPKSMRMFELSPKYRNDKTRFRLEAQTKVVRLNQVIILKTAKNYKVHGATKTQAASYLLTSSWRPPLQLDSSFPGFLSEVTKLVENVGCTVIEYPKKKSSLTRLLKYLES